MDELHEMVVVAGVELDEKVHAARGHVALHHLGHLAQGLHHRVVARRVLQVERNVGASLIAYFFRVEDELRTLDDTEIGKFLNTLVDSRTAHVAGTRHLKKWNASILGNEFEDFLVQ